MLQLLGLFLLWTFVYNVYGPWPSCVSMRTQSCQTHFTNNMLNVHYPYLNWPQPDVTAGQNVRDLLCLCNMYFIIIIIIIISSSSSSSSFIIISSISIIMMIIMRFWPPAPPCSSGSGRRLAEQQHVCLLQHRHVHPRLQAGPGPTNQNIPGTHSK